MHVHAVDLEGLVDELTVLEDRDAPPLQNRSTHIDADRFHKSVGAVLGGRLQDAAVSHDAELVFGDDSSVPGVLDDAADAVAAHLCLGAVGIDYPHGKVCAVRAGQEIEHPVGTDAVVAITGLHAPGRVDLQVALVAVQQHEVVADALILPEFHCSSLAGTFWCRQMSSMVPRSRISSALPSQTRASAQSGRELYWLDMEKP